MLWDQVPRPPKQKRKFYKLNSKSNWNIDVTKDHSLTFLLFAQHYNWQRALTNNIKFFVTLSNTKIVHYTRTRWYNSHDGKGSLSVVWRHTTCKLGEVISDMLCLGLSALVFHLYVKRLCWFDAYILCTRVLCVVNISMREYDTKYTLS